MRYNFWSKKLFFAAIILYGTLLLAGKTEANSSDNQAPEWVISEWINSNGLTLAGLRGKVVVIDFFQLWCPGCNKFSGPLMDKWNSKFSDRKDIQLVGIHTVFEGHSQQTPKRLRQYVKEKNITYPVGVDDHVSSQRSPETMILYHTHGTPEMAIIDKKGKIRFQHFGSFNPDVVEKLINTLLNEE
ncbi:MAG: TlpA family protein disulfide reductase [Candidatus Scalindua sp.]|jgi:peroxiredoxin|nr:TlpA family protein disulfide reductase [Candidatus Scalindua sp.]MBT5304337.1 TlpA family protein disulfide reductase [Candidatus Scalindua sp.]MBT6045621.1 TlpA family protein disulfide reductase [Candidatus Scalindua sp.]MBT6227080.1 TlpA family protein disulfide reductase [Candidatus Scalindua sp.]MBT7213295.1 TlpA family protein disulfide reductase [Candidatus Scalindua sp.]